MPMTLDQALASPVTGQSGIPHKKKKAYTHRRSPSPRQVDEEDFLGPAPSLTPIEPEVILLTQGDFSQVRTSVEKDTDSLSVFSLEKEKTSKTDNKKTN